MTHKAIFFSLLIASCLLLSCSESAREGKSQGVKFTMKQDAAMMEDNRTSLNLNAMQKNHQKRIMRDHLDAVQTIVGLLAADKYEQASKTAYQRLGSTTEMKMMCASFGDDNFEKLGIEFHKSADKMSEVFKRKDKNKSLEALSNTLSYCIRCHASYRQ